MLRSSPSREIACLILPFAASFALAGPRPAQAQLRGRTSAALTPATSVTLPDDAHGVITNPAALGFLDSWSLAYIHAEAEEEDRYRQQGDALRFATPVLFGVALGASIESVRPTRSTAASSRGMGTLALAYAPSSQLSFGTSLRAFASDDPNLGGLVAWDVATAWRPSASFGAALVVRDLSGPIFGGPGPLADPASFLLGVTWRPEGTDSLTLDLAGALDTNARVGVRGVVQTTVPYIGRLFAAVEAEGLDDEPIVTALGGVAIDWGQVGVGGGAFWSDEFQGATPGFFVTARADGVSRRGIPRGRYVLDLEVEGIGARGIVSLVRRLDRALHDDEVAGVFLRFRGTGMGSAYAQEVRLMITSLEEAGKPVLCHLDAGSGAELYACAAGSGSYLDPAGGVRLSGISGTSILFGDFLRNLGVRTDFVRIGRYKSAVEQYTNSRLSGPARDQRQVLYEDAFERRVFDLASDWSLSRGEVRARINEGPYLTPEAVGAELVEGEADENDLRPVLERRFAGYPRREERSDWASRRWQDRYVGVVMVDGDIVDGDNVDIPLIGIQQSGGRTVVEAIEAFAADPRCRAMIVRVDSPGGSALASDQMWRAVRRARERKPVIASMGAVAASGGYYVASAGQEIWADPSTLTGSIGIFFGKVDFQPIAENLGVGLEVFRVGDHAGLESLFRPFTPEERALVADKIRIWYRLFLRRIHEGRGMAVEDVHALGQGRVWSGDAALREGLVDRLGGFGAALARARELGELPVDAPIRMAPSRPSTLLDYVLGDTFSGAGATVAEEGEGGLDPALQGLDPAVVSGELRTALSLLLAMARVEQDVPLARLESIGALP